MRAFHTFSNLLGLPVDFVLRLLNLEVGEAWYVLAKIFVFIGLLYVFSKIARFSAKSIRKLFHRDRLLTPEEKEAIELVRDGKSREQTGLYALPEEDGTQDISDPATILELRGEFVQAAKLHRKKGNLYKAADCFAKAGYRGKAATLFLRLKEYQSAADMFALEKKYRRAARLYQKANAYKRAAECYFLARRYSEGVIQYLKFFQSGPQHLDERLACANQCVELLKDTRTIRNVPPESLRQLKTLIASEFERNGHWNDAAGLYHEAGDLSKAAVMFLRSGNLTLAEKCYREAGKHKEASLALGKHLESQQRWPDAAQAYRKAEAYMEAGLCFTKAGLYAEAAKVFEQAGAQYRAGLAYAHARKFEDAIRCLQKIRENEPEFNLSRALLGKVFFEMHDYAHCAATLSNHLTGMRVESGNIEYFYMLALAYEQMGDLEQSRDLLLKIHSVNTSYRDVTTRLSNVASRISMGKDRDLGQPVEEPMASCERSIETIQKQIGTRYRLERELGRGGMGLVYLARDTQLDRPVALKFLGGLVEQSEEFHERFMREARAAAKLNHPNIISIYDIGGSRNRVYIAMEYVEGGSLHRYLRSRGKLTPRETVSIFVQVCSALAAIHDSGIVHRDIKPENILIAKGGLVKLTDFGLAKISDSRVTKTGAVMGTPSYMAPEQVLGKEADPRTDLYATGLVMYECLTGKTAFEGEDVLEKQLTWVPPPPAQIDPTIPPHVDQIVMKCIEKDPSKRYPSAKELLSDLRKT